MADGRYIGESIGGHQSEISNVELDGHLTIVLILLEREGDVDGPLVAKRVLPFGGTPGNRAEDAAVLLQRHLEVALFQLARAVDDLHSPGGKHRTRVAGAERCERGHAGRDAAADRPEREIAVDAQ